MQILRAGEKAQTSDMVLQYFIVCRCRGCECFAEANCDVERAQTADMVLQYFIVFVLRNWFALRRGPIAIFCMDPGIG